VYLVLHEALAPVRVTNNAGEGSEISAPYFVLNDKILCIFITAHNAVFGLPEIGSHSSLRGDRLRCEKRAMTCMPALMQFLALKRSIEDRDERFSQHLWEYLPIFKKVLSKGVVEHPFLESPRCGPGWLFKCQSSWAAVRRRPSTSN
jgi:hypothetical protein